MRSRLIRLILLVTFNQSLASAAEPTSVDVFVGGQDGYFAYRIPALLTTKSGALLAFRPTGQSIRWLR